MIEHLLRDPTRVSLVLGTGTMKRRSRLTSAGIATENPSELFRRQLSKTWGMNLIIEIANLMVEIKYSQSNNSKFPIHVKIPPVIAAVQATAMRTLNTRDGCVG